MESGYENILLYTCMEFSIIKKIDIKNMKLKLEHITDILNSHAITDDTNLLAWKNSLAIRVGAQLPVFCSIL